MNTFPCNYFVCFINFFLVPALTLWLFGRKKKFLIQFDALSFLRYILCVVSNLILTHFFVVFARVFFHHKIWNDGCTYTVLAVFSAVLIFLFYDLIKKIPSDIDEEEK